MTDDISFMARAIQLAKNGLGTTRPNPMVGCVIVHEGIVIGEGYTNAYGGPHAEVNAIASVKDKSILKFATLYVTLEPCSHHGKTPPCVDSIVAHQIPKIVVGLPDPNPLVSGKGIEKLKQSGCKVTLSEMEAECREHHKRFLTFQEKKRPYIILKWAETEDGFIAPERERRKRNPEPYWITNLYSRRHVHQWRAEEQAILVGTNTALEDNPKLDVRHSEGENPYRIVLDRSLKIKGDYHLLDGSIPTMIFTEIEDKTAYLKGITYHQIDFSKDVAQQICTALWKHNLTSVLVEGGAQTLQTFLDANLWDEARVFIGNQNFTAGIIAPKFSGKLVDTEKIELDILKYYRND